jgi:hypothetical protein
MSTPPPPVPPANPYRTPPPAPVSAARVSSDVAGPAFGLLVVAILGGASQIMWLFVSILGIGVGSLFGDLSEPWFVDWLREMFGGIFFFLVGILIAGFVLYASIEMLKLRRWGLAVAASVMVMIPCLHVFCCFLGLPIGIWSLVVLMRQDVKAAFQ